MLRRLLGMLKHIQYSPQQIEIPSSMVDMIKEKIFTELCKNEEFIYKIIDKESGIAIRPFIFKAHKNIQARVIYIDGLVNTDSIEENILKPLMKTDFSSSLRYASPKDYVDILIHKGISFLNCFSTDSLQKVIESLFDGHAILFIENSPNAILVDAKGWEKRSIEAPETEIVTRGPREGFIEDLQTNITMVRRKFKNPKLRFEFNTLGRYSKTKICISYMDGICSPEILAEVKERLGKINLDVILESGYVEQFIEDRPLSPFPTIGYTERPDVLIGKLLEGRIAIFIDGTPFVLTAPKLFIESIQTSEDYYRKTVFASALRIIRLLALFLTICAPAIYVSTQTFHHEIIPFKLLLSIAAAREGIPFSSFLEALIMIILFELIKEAGVRMPRPVGQAVSIVGAIVLGQATVEAGITSPLMVIVIAVTAITGFVVPDLEGTVFITRLYLLALGNIIGYYGISFGLITIFIHLCNLKSFGIEFLSPIAPIHPLGLKDYYIRAPLWSILVKSKYRIKKEED